MQASSYRNVHILGTQTKLAYVDVSFHLSGPLTCAEENKGMTAIAVDNITLDLSGNSLTCREHCAQVGKRGEPS